MMLSQIESSLLEEQLQGTIAIRKILSKGFAKFSKQFFILILN